MRKWIPVGESEKNPTVFWQSVPMAKEKSGINARYWTIRTLPPTHTDPATAEQKTPKCQGKKQTEAVWQGEQNDTSFCVSGKEKNSLSSLDKTDGKPVEPLALVSSSQQMELMDFSVFSLVGSAFPEVSGQVEQSGPAWLASGDCLILDQNHTEQFKEKNQKLLKDCCCSLSRPGKGKKKKLLA